jgi:predicted HTH domain antitoxin
MRLRHRFFQLEHWSARYALGIEFPQGSLAIGKTLHPRFNDVAQHFLVLDAITVVEKEEKIEETTAIRKLIKIGYETYISDLYKSGKLSLADVTRQLDISQIEALELLLSRGVKGNLDAADIVQSLEKFAKT